MSNLPTQYDQDEQDLDRVKIGTYIFSGLVGLGAVLSTISVLTGLGASASLGGGLFFLIAGIVGVVSSVLYAYVNYRSAKAIAQRVDPHLTYFVSGMNLMAFPFGTLLSWYTWSVLTRPTVQELYKQGTPALPPAGNKGKPKVGAKKRQPYIVADEDVPLAWQDAVAHVDEAEEKLWKELEERHTKGDAKEEAKESKKDAEKDAGEGPIRLVQGD